MAGPVTAAAVILPHKHNIRNLMDSKKLGSRRRANMAKIIKEQALCYAVSFVDQAEIDRINILQASLKAMRQAVEKLEPKPTKVLVDGNKAPEITGMQVTPIIKGDATTKEISAASILAKTARDELMLKYDKFFPEYGFARHKGYGTKFHLEALASYGACELHRKSFAPVKRLVSK